MASLSAHTSSGFQRVCTTPLTSNRIRCRHVHVLAADAKHQNCPSEHHQTALRHHAGAGFTHTHTHTQHIGSVPVVANAIPTQATSPKEVGGVSWGKTAHTAAIWPWLDIPPPQYKAKKTRSKGTTSQGGTERSAVRSNRQSRGKWRFSSPEYTALQPPRLPPTQLRVPPAPPAHLLRGYVYTFK